MKTVSQVYAELRAGIEKDMAEETQGIDIHNIIARVLTEKFNGKKVTKRLETIVTPLIRAYLKDEKALVWWSTDYGLFQIQVRPTGVEWNNRRGFYVANDRTVDNYKAASFGINHDQCHAAPAVQRNMKRRRLLGDESDVLQQIAGAIVATRNARADLELLTDYETIGGAVQYIAQGMAAKDE